MEDQQPEAILGTLGIEAFQIEATAFQTHKVIRFRTPLGTIALMATKKCLLEIARAMIEIAEKMPEPS